MNVLELGFRIKQAIGLTGYNVKEFCERTGRSRVTTALWISGRGGIIKDSSLTDLCFDLKTCSVTCNPDWLKTGNGAPPILISHLNINETKEDLNFLELNFDEIKDIIYKLDSNKYFKYENKKYLIIGLTFPLNELAKNYNKNVCIILKNEMVVGFSQAYCNKSNTLVINSLENETRCINANEIEKIGGMVFLLNKKKC